MLQLTDEAQRSLSAKMGSFALGFFGLAWFFFFFLTEMLGLKCFEVAGYCIEIRLLSF